MVVAYALPVVEEAIPSTFREAEISSESRMWKEAMNEEMKSLYKNDMGTHQVAQREEGYRL